jgi:hypothetical protein
VRLRTVAGSFFVPPAQIGAHMKTALRTWISEQEQVGIRNISSTATIEPKANRAA